MGKLKRLICFMALSAGMSAAMAIDSFEIQDMVSEGNARLPRNVSADVVIDSMSFAGGHLVYNHSIVNTPGERVVPGKLGKIVAAQMINKSCSTPIMRDIIDSGFPITFNYSGSDGYFILGIIVGKGECARYEYDKKRYSEEG